MMLENFITEVQGSTLIVKVNRPKALNALNSAVMKEFESLLDNIESGVGIAKIGEIRTVILTGSGDKAFIAGADIAEMSNLSQSQALAFAKLGQSVTKKIEDLRLPVIAAVNGFALGGGCEMAISCDFIIASSKAVFGQPEVCLGLTTGFGGAVRLAEFVGWPVARELIYSGRRINADEALRVGLANKVVEHDRLIPEALAVADEIGRNSPLAITVLKKAMGKIRNKIEMEERLNLEARAFSEVFTSYDQREGTKAFLEKRKAAFKGN